MTDHPDLVAMQQQIEERRRELAPRRSGLEQASAASSTWEKLVADLEEQRLADPEGFAVRQAEIDRQIRDDHVERERAAEIDRRRATLRRAGVDEETREILAPAIDGPPVIAGHAGSALASAAVTAFVSQRDRRTLTLWGPTGHGKTWAALWALAAGRGCLVFGANVRPSREWDELRAEALKADLLVFDELGREPSGEWFSAEAASLVETRQTRGQRTIVTSNLPVRPAGLASAEAAVWRGRTMLDRYGDRLVDRLFDARYGKVLRIQGHQSIRETLDRGQVPR